MTSEVSIVLSISELTRRIKSALAERIGTVAVEGEISNIKRYSSGHTYFVLKDESAQLSAVLFSGVREALPDTSCLKDGQKVRAEGPISVFEGRGQYQMVVRKMVSAGAGDLLARYEQLKKKLQEEGLFESARKKPLPLLPRRIGVVTSPSGAVLHDILNVLRRRFPGMGILLTPVKVQGEGAADSIANAVRWLNASCGAHSKRPVDVIILGRGGGSLEDLWAFNEEVVARAIYDSRIPVISAVGHAVDYALSDFVADLRAPTPSAAAELVVKPKAEFESGVRQCSEQMSRLLHQRVDLIRDRLRRLRAAAVLTRPEQVLSRYAQRVDHWEMRMTHVIQRSAVRARQRCEVSSARLHNVRERRIDELRVRIERCFEDMRSRTTGRVGELRIRVSQMDRQLVLLNPLKILDRGYSLTRLADGSLVRSVGDVSPGCELRTVLRDGWIGSTVGRSANNGGTR